MDSSEQLGTVPDAPGVEPAPIEGRYMVVKYRAVASDLAEQIRRGDFGDPGRLPGELELARRFEVSRGTIRQALATLKSQGMIETATGAGSFVTYDGLALDDGFGWTRSLARTGVLTRTDVVRVDRCEDVALAGELGLASPLFLVVERLRRLDTGEAISLERSRIPWRASLQVVLADGLVDGSLQSTMAAHDLVAAWGEESVGVAVLGDAEARLLGRDAGEAFLESEQRNFDVRGTLIEAVVSLLDPGHFRMRHTFGTPPRPR